MSAISDNLIHFLGRSLKESPNKQFEICKSIFENGLRTGECSIKFPDGSSVFNQIVCFTDIPLRECDEHTAVYGKFGIGFKKSYVKNAGGNPARYFVDYVPGQIKGTVRTEPRGIVYRHLWDQFKFLHELKQKTDASSSFTLHNAQGSVLFDASRLTGLVASMLYVFSFEKEMGDLGPARDDTNELDAFYKEREWRLAPLKQDVDSGLLATNDGVRYLYKFGRSDVNMVVVPNEDVRVAMLDYFLSLRTSADNRLREFGENPVPIIGYDDLKQW